MDPEVKAESEAIKKLITKEARNKLFKLGDEKFEETSQSEEDPEVAKAGRVAAAHAVAEEKKAIVKQHKMEQALVQLELNEILNTIKPSSKNAPKKLVMQKTKS